MDELLDFVLDRAPGTTVVGCILLRELARLIGNHLLPAQWKRLYEYMLAGINGFELPLPSECRMVAAEAGRVPRVR